MSWAQATMPQKRKTRRRIAGGVATTPPGRHGGRASGPHQFPMMPPRGGPGLPMGPMNPVARATGYKPGQYPAANPMQGFQT